MRPARCRAPRIFWASVPPRCTSQRGTAAAAWRRRCWRAPRGPMPGMSCRGRPGFGGVRWIQASGHWTTSFNSKRVQERMKLQHHHCLANQLELSDVAIQATNNLPGLPQPAIEMLIFHCERPFCDAFFCPARVYRAWPRQVHGECC